MALALTAGLLIAGAVYLFLQREMLRVILGFVLLSHGVNLILMAAGGTQGRTEPFGTATDTSDLADPLPQAFVLTAIVIAFSITIYLLVLAVTGRGDDDTAPRPEAPDGAEPDSDAAPAATSPAVPVGSANGAAPAGAARREEAQP